MFDSYLIRPQHTTNVHVEQLPHDTADAARLYGECMKKARAELASATIEAMGAHNEVKVLTAAADIDLANCNRRLRVLFTINGTKHDVYVSVDEFGGEITRRICQEVMQQVAAKLTPQQARALR